MRPCFYWLPLGVVLVLPGCNKEQHEKTSEPVASVDKTAGLDPELAKAVAAASSRETSSAAPDSSGGPPANGIFAPGRADAEIKRGAPPKITLGGNGTAPRVTLTPAQPKPGWKTQGTLELQVASGQQQPPIPVELSVSVEASKPKAAADADAGTANNLVAMTVKVTGAKLGLTGIPQDLAASFSKLKGSKVEYDVAPDGAGSGYHMELAPGADAARDELRQLSDAIALVTFPLPSEPLGAGAVWMTTSREGVFGLDLVTYRLVKVESVSGNAVTLSVSTKRYATSTRFDFEGLPPDAPHELSEFECKSDGKLVIKAGTPFPASGDVDSALGASLLIPGQQGQQGQLQIQTHVTLDFTKH